MKNPALESSVPKALSANERPIRFIGMLIVLSTLAFFILWAIFAPLDSAALASGVVVVKAHKKVVQHLDGGIVSKILVSDGDLVQEGEPLLVLDETQIRAQLEIARGQSIALAAQVARLRAERDQLPHVTYPEAFKNTQDTRIVEAKLAEDNVFYARKKNYDGEIEILTQRIGQISSKLVGLKGQVDSKTKLTTSYAEEIRDLNDLLAEGFVDKQRLRDIERNQALQNGEIAQLNAEIATNQMLIGETRLQILQTRQKFLEEVTAKLTEAEAALNDANERVKANQDKLDRIVIKAPASGMVLGLAVHTENGVISPGNPILEIVPQDAELVVEAKVSPIDIDRVSIGLQAEVRFSAFKQSLIPKMDGNVVQLSADRLEDEKTGEPYYLARIELTPESAEKLGGLILLPGMPAEVLIKTGERTLLEYLIHPAKNALARAFIED